MLVIFCDLCGSIVKDTEAYLLYIDPPSDINTMHESYQDQLLRIVKTKKIVCSKCYDVFTKIFDLRMERLCELTQEINSIANVPMQPTPKERKRHEKK
jgi:hypothetical protein